MVNDYSAAYPSLAVAWQVLGAGDATLAGGTITCAVPTDSLQQVGEVAWDIPAAGGSYRVSLALERDAESLSSNDYTIEILVGAGLRGRGSQYRQRSCSAAAALKEMVRRTVVRETITSLQ